MTVKSDRWIRQMASEAGLIQPFNETLVREVDGRRIFSAGASSYGYDMRLADDGFRVFSPIHGREIDPKRFDEESLVEPPLRTADDGSKYYLLPPHSYGLGVTVETFRMPRNVTGIALGKCLTRDARIVNAATGDLVSIADFTSDGKVAAYQSGRIRGRRALAVLNQGRKKVWKLKTDLGYTVTATSNHPFLTVSGWKKLEDLKPGGRLAVARRIPIFGSVELPDWQAMLLGLMVSSKEHNILKPLSAFASTDEAVLGVLKQYAQAGWLKPQKLNGVAPDGVPSCIFRTAKRGVALFLRVLFSCDAAFYRNQVCAQRVGLEYCTNSERLARDVQHLLLRFGIVSRFIEKAAKEFSAYSLQIFRAEDVKLFLDEIGFATESDESIKVEDIIRSWPDAQFAKTHLYGAVPSALRTALKEEARTLQTRLYHSGIHAHEKRRDAICLELERFIAQYPESRSGGYLDADIMWDEITSIEYVGEEDVFDIAVPHIENFIANNIVVHNSTYARAGLLVNTTPLEAGWTGRLVVELANLADLPLRVYVNEGIGQVIFLESDENCDVSYEDRGGKYQSQTGLTYSRL